MIFSSSQKKQLCCKALLIIGLITVFGTILTGRQKTKWRQKSWKGERQRTRCVYWAIIRSQWGKCGGGWSSSNQRRRGVPSEEHTRAWQCRNVDPKRERRPRSCSGLLVVQRSQRNTSRFFYSYTLAQLIPYYRKWTMHAMQRKYGHFKNVLFLRYLELNCFTVKTLFMVKIMLNI